MSPIKAHVGKLTKTFRRSANSRKRSIDWVTTFENLRPVLAASPCEIGQSDSAKSSQHLRPEANPLLAENLFEKGESDSARNSLRLGPEAHPLLATNLFEDEHSDTTSVISDIMASSRFSTYMDPALSLFSRLPESKVRTFQSNSIPSSAPFKAASHDLGAFVQYELANQVFFRSIYPAKRHADPEICAGLYEKASEATRNRDS